MLNLIFKDILLQKKTLMILLPILFFYLFTGSSPSYVAIIFCIAIIMNAFAIDEKSSINLLLNSLPYTRKEIVSSKYIGAIVFIILVLLTIFFGNWIIHREIIQWKQMFLIISIVAIFVSLSFPFSYLLKSQYLMIAMGVSFVIYMIIANKFIPDINDRIREAVQTFLSFSTSQQYLLLFLSVVIFYSFSWMLSIRIYSRKVF
ncbi:ABC-2 transporter permease [Cytobacillus massiliigabonensis]|uniref:ABC-2 transporter permease n=1 Tax=Cytobacillus massiliigabonensis TaxID=1871011 RepID=UPI000C841051|nr:ABC-2 transporter permease [Cytobacillus massiliigabonensis]